MKSLLRAAAPYLAYLYLTFVKWTTRMEWVDVNHVGCLERREKNFIYAFWHNRQVLFTYSHRGHNIAILVSRSRDGDVVAKVMKLSRIPAIRGSSSRNAVESTIEMIETAEKGVHVGLTPDGPKGPVYKVKPGVLYVAQKTGYPIIPISNATSRKLVLKKAWDRFQVPLPFARSCIVHGAPISVGENDDLKEKAEDLERALRRITEEAERRVEV